MVSIDANPFAALQEESSDNSANIYSSAKVRWSMDDIARWNYTVRYGTDTPEAPTQPLESRFMGHCYSCGCAKHSQNYCPIRRCKHCLMYGHSSKVCPLMRAFKN